MVLLNVFQQPHTPDFNSVICKVCWTLLDTTQWSTYNLTNSINTKFNDDYYLQHTILTVTNITNFCTQQCRSLWHSYQSNSAQPSQKSKTNSMLCSDPVILTVKLCIQKNDPHVLDSDWCWAMHVQSPMSGSMQTLNFKHN
jgi:hypothetical protein